MPRPAANVPARRAPAAMLAWSEARLDGWGGPAPGLSLWVSRTPAVAIGQAQTAGNVANLAAMERDGVGLLRRQSGGGAVLLSPGVLCWEAWATEDAAENLPGGGAGIRPAYAALSLPVRAGLERLGVETVLTGVCDLAVTAPGREARKIAGMAQLRRHGRVLVHGCVLVRLDPDELEKYLPIPAEADAPDYRRGRGHRDFCVGVWEAMGVDPGEELEEGLEERLVNRLAGTVADSAAELGWVVLSPPEEEELPRPVRRLLDEKYCSEEWNLRRARGTNRTNGTNNRGGENHVEIEVKAR